MIDDAKTLLLIWSIMGAATGTLFAAHEKACPRKNIAAYLNPAYIVSCEIWKPRWETK